jgi:exodeoxyribonuclease V alpha subunit
MLLVLPQRPSPVLTRELLYTAVTRARRGVAILGTADIVRAAVAERVQRASGLRDRLWGEKDSTTPVLLRADVASGDSIPA